jgi:transcriptional regulator with XRE-family HTH domain
MNDREREICTRVRKFRESTKWSQDDVARELGISRDRVASVEYGRTPLRYDLAKWLAEKLDVGLHWIAEGRPPIRPYLPPDQAEESKIAPHALLSEAYRRLKRNFVHRLSLIDARGSMAWLERMPGIPPGEAYEWALRGVVKRTLEKLPPHLRFEFLQAILAAISKFAAQHQGEVAAFRHEPVARPVGIPVASQRGRASAAARELNRRRKAP